MRFLADRGIAKIGMICNDQEDSGFIGGPGDGRDLDYITFYQQQGFPGINLFSGHWLDRVEVLGKDFVYLGKAGNYSGNITSVNCPRETN